MSKPLSTLARTDLTDRRPSPVNHFGQIWEIWHLASGIWNLAVDCAAQKKKRQRSGANKQHPSPTPTLNQDPALQSSSRDHKSSPAIGEPAPWIDCHGRRRSIIPRTLHHSLSTPHHTTKPPSTQAPQLGQGQASPPTCLAGHQTLVSRLPGRTTTTPPNNPSNPSCSPGPGGSFHSSPPDCTPGYTAHCFRQRVASTLGPFDQKHSSPRPASRDHRVNRTGTSSGPSIPALQAFSLRFRGWGVYLVSSAAQPRSTGSPTTLRGRPLFDAQLSRPATSKQFSFLRRQPAPLSAAHPPRRDALRTIARPQRVPSFLRLHVSPGTCISPVDSLQSNL